MKSGNAMNSDMHAVDAVDAVCDVHSAAWVVCCRSDNWSCLNLISYFLIGLDILKRDLLTQTSNLQTE